MQSTLNVVQSPSIPHPALEVYDRNMKRTIKVAVVEPVTITARESWNRSTTFTAYNILIETDHWAFQYPFSSTVRRFSDFVWLRSKLCAHHPNKVVPPLPKKRIFASRSESVIEERRFGLGKFLQRVMRSSELLSDPALHLFLQSDMTTDEIDKKLTEIPSLRNNGPGLNPYLLRSLSSGSSTASSDYNERDSELSETEQNDADLRKSTFNPDIEPQKVSPFPLTLVITHEDEDEVVEVPNSSPMESPILSSLILTNSATESFPASKGHLQLPLCPLPVVPFQQIRVK